MQRMLGYWAKARYRLGLQGSPRLYYIVPGVNWSLDWDGRYITENVQKQFGLAANVAPDTQNLYGQLLHFGSLWDMAASVNSKAGERNHLVGTIFHGDKELDEFAEAFNRVLGAKERFLKIHTSSKIMEARLTAWGVSRDRLVRIPLGVDTKHFAVVGQDKKLSIREQMGIPKDAFVIGSFHKDGVGMDEGMEPKLIKGPDVLLKVIEQVSKNHKVFVLLSAPARGYVKAGLEKLGVEYKHVLLNDYLDIPRMYQASDVYLMTSREEGGPKGVLEALATGTPLVATRVGMAPDVITPGEDGLLADSEDVDTLTSHVVRLIEEPDLRRDLSARGLETIQAYDWSIIAAQYYQKIYQPILESLGY